MGDICQGSFRFQSMYSFSAFVLCPSSYLLFIVCYSLVIHNQTVVYWWS